MSGRPVVLSPVVCASSSALFASLSRHEAPALFEGNLEGLAEDAGAPSLFLQVEASRQLEDADADGRAGAGATVELDMAFDFLFSLQIDDEGGKVHGDVLLLGGKIRPSHEIFSRALPLASVNCC